MIRPSTRFFLIALALAAVMGPTVSARASFVVSPMELHLTVSPGAADAAALSLRNTGRRPLLLKLYLADSRFGMDGGEEEVPLGTLERSCAPWLLLDNALVELAPGESRQFDLRLEVPPEARGSYWTKLYVEEMSQPEPSTREVAGRRYEVFIKQRMGVRIFAELPGTDTPEALVQRVSVTREKDGRSYSMRVANAGRTLLRCRGTIELRDERGDVKEVLTLGSAGGFLVFPGGERELSARGAAELGPGTYTALAVVDYGGDQLVAGEEVFKVEGAVPMLVRGAGEKEPRAEQAPKGEPK